MILTQTSYRSQPLLEANTLFANVHHACKYIIKQFTICFIEGARSYLSKSSFMFHLKNQHPKVIKSKFEFKLSSCLNVWSNFVIWSCLYFTVCVSLIMVTITRHVFINILQAISKSLKTGVQIGMDSFKSVKTITNSYCHGCHPCCTNYVYRLQPVAKLGQLVPTALEA